MSARDQKRDASDKTDGLLALALSAESPVGPHPDAEQIAAWHESAVDAAEALQIERHIGQCDQCFAVWSGLLSMDATVQSQHYSLANRLRRVLQRRFGDRAIASGLVTMMAIAFVGIALSTLLIDTGDSIPGYSLTLEGNTRFFRGDSEPLVSDAVAVFEPGNQFRLILTPDTAIDDPVAVRLFLARPSAPPVELLTPQAQITAKGAIRIDGQVGSTVTLPPGTANLYVVIGFSDDLPDAQTVIKALTETDTTEHKDWRAWRIPIELRFKPR